MTKFSLLALGVVFGDIGTSPLYAVRVSLGYVAHPASTADVLGILSLILWALILVICFKYQIFVLRADNRGDGGIIALMALLRGRRRRSARRLPITRRRRGQGLFAGGAWVVVLGIFGASLLYGDGMITPSITVLSAVEGLRTAFSSLAPLVIPLTIAILFVLFWLQRRGSEGVARWYAPVMVVWFLVIAGLGVASFARTPEVLLAFNPAWAVDFFVVHKAFGLVVLGAVFLSVTGAEVLYAAMGHFGRRPIRYAWFLLVLPALMLNYLGQGALVLRDPGAASNPFFHLAPAFAGSIPIYILVGLATAAAIIASQAAISGAFSLMTQAIGLNMSPRIKVERTSLTERGQVYVPALNYLLMIACIVLVLGFQTSDNLAGAYGVAISTDMLITTALMFLVMRRLWNWPFLAVSLLTALFLCMDIPFWAANLLKLPEGGWVPYLVALVAFAIMRIWTRNRERLIATLRGRTEPLGVFLDRIGRQMPPRVPGTAVFLTSPGLGVPPMLNYHLRHNQILHEQVLLLSVITRDVPKVMPAQRIEIEPYGYGFYRVILYYGFRQAQPVMRSLEHAAARGLLDLDPERLTFYFGRETIVPAPYGGPLFALRRRLAAWWRTRHGIAVPEETGPARVGLRQAISEHLFVIMHRNALRATDFFNIPDDYTVEIGQRLHTTSLARPAPDARS
ncbi:MAG: potassium transporter Kup [Gammaproteobacteria bacterium]